MAEPAPGRTRLAEPDRPTREPLELLLRTVGPDRCLFGTERPGSGSAKNPATGRQFDDLKPVIEEIAWLSPDERALVFEGNARRLYRDLPQKEA